MTELNGILQVYYGDLTTVIYKIKSEKINQSQAISKIEDSLMKINKHWNSYESHYKKDMEIEYVDYFKQYDDTFGHIEYDAALKSVAKVLKDTLKRPGDFVFRLGGEEFGVLLTNTDEKNSVKLSA